MSGLSLPSQFFMVSKPLYKKGNPHSLWEYLNKMVWTNVGQTPPLASSKISRSYVVLEQADMYLILAYYKLTEITFLWLLTVQSPLVKHGKQNKHSNNQIFVVEYV